MQLKMSTDIALTIIPSNCSIKSMNLALNIEMQWLYLVMKNNLLSLCGRVYASIILDSDRHILDACLRMQ